jgi:hypothetical protein
LLDFKTGEITPCQLSKALDATLRNLSSSRSNGFEFTGFQKLSANSEVFGT